MISSTTLILATLVFNAASVFGAPIRLPSTAPEVEVRHHHVSQPTLPRAVVPIDVVDAQPVHKRSADGTANRPRLAREVVPEHETRDTASESVEIRDSLPEVEAIVRRYPRRHLAEFYEKRSPEPAPAPGTPSAPSAQAEARSEPAPPVVRRFPRQALYERHMQRAAEPAPKPEARNEYDPEGHFVRDHNPELMAKRDALPTDNIPREPEPAPIPEPAPNPTPAENSEKVRRYPRRVLAEYYEKRQDTQDPPTPVTTPSPSPSTTSTSSPSGSTTTSTTTAIPASLEKAIADAIVKGSSSPVTNVGTDVTGQKSSYSDTTITIKITHQANSDVKMEKPSGTTPTPSSSPSASTTSTATGSTSSPTSSGTAEGSTAEPKKTDDSEGKPEETKPEGTTGGASSSSETPDGGASAQPDAEPRALPNSDAAVEPLTKRKLGLSGALWASWTRRNTQA